MRFNKLLAIAASDPNGVIGKNGHLPWDCPEELRHFSQTVAGSTLVMGYRTFLTLPTSYYKEDLALVFAHQKPDVTHPNLLFVSSLGEFFSLDLQLQDLYVIGGAEIFRLFLEENLIEQFLLTTMTHCYEGDTFFPLELLEEWPSQTVKQRPLFTIRRYLNPRQSHADSNLQNTSNYAR